jgi:hypothetical protein
MLYCLVIGILELPYLYTGTRLYNLAHLILPLSLNYSIRLGFKDKIAEYAGGRYVR